MLFPLAAKAFRQQKVKNENINKYLSLPLPALIRVLFYDVCSTPSEGEYRRGAYCLRLGVSFGKRRRRRVRLNFRLLLSVLNQFVLRRASVGVQHAYYISRNIIHFLWCRKIGTGKDRVHFVESTHGSLNCGWDEGGVVLRLSGEGEKIERLVTIDAKQI